MSDTGHLPTAMAAAVPLHIMQLKEKGGPNADDMAEAQKTSGMLGERGDVLLFGPGKKGKKGECADLFNRTARAIAVLSFCPGGITIFGYHFEAEKCSDAEE